MNRTSGERIKGKARGMARGKAKKPKQEKGKARQSKAGQGTLQLEIPANSMKMESRCLTIYIYI